MKYLRISNQSDFVPRIAVLGRDTEQGPWIELRGLDHDDAVGPRVFDYFDENTTNVEVPTAYLNIAYAIAYAVRRPHEDGPMFVRWDDIGRAEIGLGGDWYMVITSETVSIYR